MRILTDNAAIQTIINNRGHFAVWTGAGTSVEAGVKSASEICKDCRTRFTPPELNLAAAQKWVDQHLSWGREDKRYSACLQKFNTPAARVEYFRSILADRQPSFVHYAIALLATHGWIKPTLITTNFDKLLEIAFAKLDVVDWQALRHRDEVRFWHDTAANRYYVLKLHGDCETHNIANTLEETISIDAPLDAMVRRVVSSSGLLVIGSAGHEKSVVKLLDSLSQTRGGSDRVLDFGLLWGVYVGGSRPKNVTEDVAKTAVESSLSTAVGENIRELMARSPQNSGFAFFPIWGAGNFFSRLIATTHDKALTHRSNLYLDQYQRVQSILEAAGVPYKTVSSHLKRLHKNRERLKDDKPSQRHERVLHVSHCDGKRVVRLSYGDLAKQSSMIDPDFAKYAHAVVSPDDTTLNAGGGAALALAKKAGMPNILNELSKFAPVAHGHVAVTSGGHLPVHYIFHAAAVRITPNGNYEIDESDVAKCFTKCLELTQVLGVRVLHVPLLGAGVAGLDPTTSLKGITTTFSLHHPNAELIVNIVVRHDSDLSRTDAVKSIREVLSDGWQFTA